MPTYYKFLLEDGSAPYGHGKWNLPTADGPGEWMPPIEDIRLCESGYHVCEKKDLRKWRNVTCYIAEVRGKYLVGDDKSVHQQARLVKDTKFDRTALRLYAADCAERSLRLIVEQKLKATTQNTIFYVKAYAFGLISAAELRVVRKKQCDAANAAANAAAAAAYAAANADAANAAANAAADAAAAAAYAAANADAYAAANADAADAAAAYADAADAADAAAARKKEHDWQNDRLEQYILGEVDLEKTKAEVVEWLEKNGGPSERA